MARSWDHIPYIAFTVVSGTCGVSRAVVMVGAVGNPRGCLGAPGTPSPKILKILTRYGGVPGGS
eukprot:COSAG01_NODE_50283_length_364_cov_1.630189_1_plen_63_part_10